mgnify:CR=1 FL=1
MSLPFPAITAGRLLREDPVVLRLSRAAVFSTVIRVPFAVILLLRDALIPVVVPHAFAAIAHPGHRPHRVAWDAFSEHAFALRIVPGCTGIMAMALMPGVISKMENPPARQAFVAFLLAVPALFPANLFRVVVVFIAVSGTWSAGFPDPTGTGDANFFRARNVIAEGLAVLFLLVPVWALVRIIPRPGVFARAPAGVYRDRLVRPAAPLRDTP